MHTLVLSVDVQRLFVSMGYMAGLRPGEKQALRVRSFRERTIDVQESRNARGQLRSRLKGQRGKSRTVPVMAPLADEVEQFVERHRLMSDDILLPALAEDKQWRSFARYVLGPAMKRAAEHGYPDLARTRV
jgi:integrase